jgi:hydroxylamine reductase
VTEMFCYQCEQTAGGTGCTKGGVCGKKPEVARKQDELICALIGLARAAENKETNIKMDALIMQGLFSTLTNVNFDPVRIEEFRQQAEIEKLQLGGAEDFNPDTLFYGDTDIVSLRSILLFGLKGMAAYAWHAHVLGKDYPEVTAWFYKGLRAVGGEHSVNEWLSLIMEFGQVNFKCMAILDEANTSTYGHPQPTRVSMNVEKGPFIVVTGHDLLDLKYLLEQTEGKGTNVYTHGEMLPAHGYPELKKYSHLKGNFGTAWQNQQKEFSNIPAPILFTTNCIMPPRDTYADRVFTTAVVGYPGMKHISEQDDKKDFSPLIQKAL